MKRFSALIAAMIIGAALTGCPASNPNPNQRKHQPAHMNIEKVKGQVIVDLYAGTMPLPELFYDMENMPKVSGADSSYVVFVNGAWPYWYYNYPAGYRGPYAYSYAVDATVDGSDLPAYDESQVKWGLALRFDNDNIPLTIWVEDFVRGESARINLSDLVPDRIQHLVDVSVIASYPGLQPTYCPFSETYSGTFCWAKLNVFEISVNGKTVTEETNNGQGLGYVEIGWPFGDVTPSKYTLGTIVDGSGTVTGAGSYDPGTKVTISAVASNGWHFDHWTVNGVTSYANPGTVTMNSNVTVTAVFKQDVITTTYTLSTSVNGQGSVSGGGTYNSGTIVTATAVAASGWHFDHWLVNGVSNSVNPNQVTMNGNVNLVAYFITDVTPPDTTGKLIVDITTSAGIVSFKANAPDGYGTATFGGIGTQSQINSVGLQLYYEAAVNGNWTDRQTFPFNGTWPVSGVVSKVSGRTLRFEVVANASGCFGDPLKMVVKLNGTLVPRVADTNGNVAYQVLLP